MSESGGDALDSVRVRFKVLKQAAPGDIVILDGSGRWILQSPASWAQQVRSALRKLTALFSQAPVESQRQAFLKSAKESVKVLLQHCRLLMQTKLFAAAMDDSGSVTGQSLKRLSAAERLQLEAVCSTIRAYCQDLHDGMVGLGNVVRHQPYADDLTFCGEIQVSLCEPAHEFFEQTFRALGVLAPALLPFFAAAPAAAQHRTPATAAAAAAAAPAPTARAGTGALPTPTPSAATPFFSWAPLCPAGTAAAAQLPASPSSAGPPTAAREEAAPPAEPKAPAETPGAPTGGPPRAELPTTANLNARTRPPAGESKHAPTGESKSK
jgi:hypothetical protein